MPHKKYGGRRRQTGAVDKISIICYHDSLIKLYNKRIIMANSIGSKNARRVLKQGKLPKIKPPTNRPSGFVFWIITILLFVMFYRFSSQSMDGISNLPKPIAYSQLYRLLEDNPSTQRITRVVIIEDKIEGVFSDGGKFIVNIPANDSDIIKTIRNNVSDVTVRPSKTFLSNLFYALGPTLLFFGLLWFFFYRGAAAGGGANRIWSFGKSRARLISGDKGRVTFKDVAGVDEAKEELQEVIEFLKDPKKFQRLGGKMPKGVLLMGPPGCGKTLLAKAVSGEAGVPFFSISGSDFVEMFVGVGAARVRDLFEQAKKSAKTEGKGAIIFMDEIDAVGRQRFAGIGGGHDEREQTLNALLVEMDGFSTKIGVILIAATNRPDVLDPALLRPGRFDRQIVIDRPDINGRKNILAVHSKDVKMDKNADLLSLAKQTPGFSGADLANLINEAALLAARRNKEFVTSNELQESIERVMAGPQRKSRVISKKEKRIVAYHESGHALLRLLMPGAEELHKVSIIPRGTSALGYTMELPIEDRYIISKTEIVNRLVVLLAGRASEQIVFNEITTGAHNDLQVATETARRMVCEFGMSDNMGHITFGRKHHEIFLGRDITEERNYSDETAQFIDKEITNIINSAYSYAKELLEKNKDKLIKLADLLLEKEVLTVQEARQATGLLQVPDKNADA
ncbi:MAG: ATP-dependent zinc metalloprotease FtsH [Candidatus Omnitrophota bacterium]|jgi:cell division protease FtsH